MKATELAKGLFDAAIFKLTQELGENGGEIITRINSDDTFRKRLANYMLAGAPDFSGKLATPLVTLDIARAIMGDSIICPQIVQKEFGVMIDTADLEDAKTIPYSIGVLGRCSKTHLLVYGYKIPISKVVAKGKFALYGKGDYEGGVVPTSTPPKGWYLLSKEIAPSGPKKGQRLATLAELMYGLNLYKAVKVHSFLFAKQYGICLLTKEGGEVCFGLGRTFTGKRYGEGSHDYWFEKDPQNPTSATICVVEPDLLPGDKVLIASARETLSSARISLQDPNCSARHIQYTLERIQGEVREGKYRLDEAGTSEEEMKQLSELAYSHREGN